MKIHSFIALGVALLSLDSAAQSPCARCEGKWKDAGALQIATSDFYDGACSAIIPSTSERWLDHVTGDLPKLTECPLSVSTPHSLRNAILTAIGDCRRIKHLAIMSHGYEGALKLPQGTLDSAKIQSEFAGLECAMAPDATISLGGCSVGAGCRGEQFMAQLATTLLPKGGTIHANTSASSTFLPGIIPHFAFSTQTLITNRGSPEPRFENSPQESQTCRKEAEECQRTFSVLVSRTYSCPQAEPHRAALTETLAGLDEICHAVPTPACGGLNGESDNFRDHYARYMNNCEVLERRLDGVGPCAGPRPRMGTTVRTAE